MLLRGAVLRFYASPPNNKLASMLEGSTMDQPAEFAAVINCSRCNSATSAKLLRDEQENVPQPGFVGANYYRKRVALAGQNPGLCPPRLAIRDARYTAALRAVRDRPSPETMAELNQVLLDFVPEWPVAGNYFPLRECNLQLDEIAYFNVVRCRTTGNSVPGSYVVSNCLSHFERWLDQLKPRVLVFIGKWGHDAAAELATSRRIPVTFMNRDRSLSSYERSRNRQEVVDLVRGVVRRVAD
jgi:uracil-DNA glycosylase